METPESTSRAPIDHPSHPAHSTAQLITVGQRLDRICDATQTAWRGGCEAASEIKSIMDIDGRVDRHPYTMMAAAAGSGYVLGGGIFSPLTARFVGLGLRLGLRLVAIPFIQRELLGFVEVARDGRAGTGSPSHQAQPTTARNQQPEIM